MKAFHEVRRYDSDFMVWHSSYKNISFLAHWHKELELIYVRSGSAHISISDESFVAHEGDLVICESGLIHYSDSAGMDNHLDFIIFDPSFLSSRFHNPRFKNPLVTKEELARYGLTEELEYLIKTVSSELHGKQAYYREIIEARLSFFWNMLKRCHPRNLAPSPAQNRRAQTLLSFQQLLDSIEETYPENVTLEKAAEQTGFSPSYFSRTFKAIVGINFVTYVTLVRVEHAARMLTEGNSRITDIALSCGFGNVRSFNRSFKEVTGLTPSGYLKNPDPDAYKITYYQRRSTEQAFVENDSPTVISHSASADSKQQE